MKDESQTSIKSSTSVISNSKKNEKNIKLANYNEREEAKIGELDNKTRCESEMKDQNEKLNHGSGVDDFNQNAKLVEGCNLDRKKGTESKSNNKKENAKINNP